MAATPALAGLDLDLDAFEGPLDLLLTLVLREELALAEVDLADIVVAFVAHLAGSDRLDLDACGEFLVLIAALLELKARALLDADDADLAELDAGEAAEELARRLAVYRQVKGAAAWLSERLAATGERHFRLGPAPLGPAPPLEPRPQDPGLLARALAVLATEPPAPTTDHMALRFPPVGQFLERWRALLRRRSRLDFDHEVAGLSRVEVAVAFLALLELCKRDEVTVSQASPFAPIRIARVSATESIAWSGRSA